MPGTQNNTNQSRPGGPSQGGRPGGGFRPGGFRGGPGGRPGQGGGRPGGGPRRDNRREEPRDEFKERVLDMRRVTRVVKGGKRFRFRATLVIGDNRGRVGVGIGKGVDVQQAVAKAKVDAKKNLFHVDLKDGRTIAHEVAAKYSAARVLLRPAEEGHGIKAGGSVRVVLSLAGVKDATAKILSRTPNKLTNALATMEALRQMKPVKRKKQAVAGEPVAGAPATNNQ